MFFIIVYQVISLGKPTALFWYLQIDNGALVFVLIESMSMAKISGTGYNTMTDFLVGQVAVW